MMVHRRLTKAYGTAIQLTCRPLFGDQDRGFTINIPKHIQVRSFETLADALVDPGDQFVYYQPPFKPLQGPDDRGADAVLIDGKARRWYLLAFASQRDGMESISKTIDRVEKALAKATKETLECIAVMVVPPWLEEETSTWMAAVGEQVAKPPKLPWYVASLDLSRW